MIVMYCKQCGGRMGGPGPGVSMRDPFCDCHDKTEHEDEPAGFGPSLSATIDYIMQSGPHCPID